ncbi:MAG: hypothetical protein ACE5PV_27980 [Candidatus Poribacteria bacterium]
MITKVVGIFILMFGILVCFPTTSFAERPPGLSDAALQVISGYAGGVALSFVSFRIILYVSSDKFDTRLSAVANSTAGGILIGFPIGSVIAVNAIGKHRTGHSALSVTTVGALAAPVAGSIIGFTTDVATGELQKGKPSWTAFGAIAGALITPITSTIAYHLAASDESDKEFVMPMLNVNF